MYRRVLPRDLFNEAKLLKCLGQVALLLYDGNYPLALEHFYPETGFLIYQDESDGSLFVDNLLLFRLPERVNIHLSTPYNSRVAYPLLAFVADEEVEVLDTEGRFSEEFLRALGIEAGR